MRGYSGEADSSARDTATTSGLVTEQLVRTGGPAATPFCAPAGSPRRNLTHRARANEGSCALPDHSYNNNAPDRWQDRSHPRPVLLTLGTGGRSITAGPDVRTRHFVCTRSCQPCRKKATPPPPRHRGCHMSPVRSWRAAGSSTLLLPFRR